MKRRIWCGTIVSGLTWLGAQGLPAQAPVAAPKSALPAATPIPAPPAPTGMPREGDLLTFRTAGQPERRVRVIRISGTIDDGLADVQDQSSNAKYSIPLKVLASMAKSAATTTPGTVPVTAPPLPPLVVTPNPAALANGRPVAAPALSAMSRPGDPRSALPSPMTARALMREPNPVAPTTPPPAPPAVAVAPPVLPIPQQPSAQPAPPAQQPTGSADDILFRPATLPSIVPQPSAAPAPPDGWSKPPAVAVPTVAAPVPPPPPTGLPPIQPAFSTVKPPVLAIAAPEYVAVPVYDFAPVPAQAPSAAPSQSVVAASAPVAAPIPVVTTPQAPAALPPPQVVVQTSLTSTASEFVPPELMTAETLLRLPPQMAEELQPYLADLSRALRPSLRERAATGLAEGRYGSRPEVKAVLARAALLDPAPSVKAHCIRLLSKLGYHESSYLDYLDGCAESGNLIVKRAAVDAVARLRVR